jgi:hypothetical protein
MAEITYEQAMQGLKAASDAGDAKAATHFAEIANSFRQTPSRDNAPISQEDAAKWGQTDSWWTNPTTPPEEGAFNRIATSGAVGLGVGAALGAPTGVGIIPGAVGGGITGLISGVSGEVARQYGAPEPVIVASELIGGGIPSAAKAVAQKGLSMFPSRGKSLASIADLGAQTNVEQNIASKSKDILFGKPSMKEGYTEGNALATQINLRKQLLGETDDTLGTIDSTKNVSEILRGRLYDNLKSLREQYSTVTSKTPATFDRFGLPASPATSSRTKVQNAFINSPEYAKLQYDIGVLKQEGGKLKGVDLNEMKTILMSEINKDPNVVKNSSQNILNLIQNGGIYQVATKGAEAETKTIINESVRNALKKRFDEYLERNLGQKDYSILKQAEAAEFTAKARDNIPSIVNAEFKGTKEMLNETLAALKNSPEGRKELAAGVFQHLRKFDDSKSILSEFAKSRSSLRQSGVFSDKQLDDITSKIKEYDKIKDSGLRFAKIQNAITFPLIGVLSSQVSSKQTSTPFGIEKL